jgi:two-component system sensor kinase FixL
MNAMDAIRELPEGDRTVVIEARHADGLVEIAVRDSGPGIAPDVAARVFDPFFTTKAHGMGMGLPVSRTIIEAHGGKLWMETGATQGTIFRFTVPVAEQTSP